MNENDRYNKRARLGSTLSQTFLPSRYLATYFTWDVVDGIPLIFQSMPPFLDFGVYLGV